MQATGSVALIALVIGLFNRSGVFRPVIVTGNPQRAKHVMGLLADRSRGSHRVAALPGLVHFELPIAVEGVSNG